MTIKQRRIAFGMFLLGYLNSRHKVRVLSQEIENQKAWMERADVLLKARRQSATEEFSQLEAVVYILDSLRQRGIVIDLNDFDLIALSEILNLNQED